MKQHRLQVLVSESLYDRLTQAAGQAGISGEAWVRQAIEQCLERESHALPGDPLAALQELDGPTADIDVMLAQIASGRS